MMEYIARGLANELFLNGLITEKEKKIYCYAIQVWLEKIIGLSVILFFSIIWKICLKTMFFLLYFSCIRGYISGYHAESFWGCLFSSIGIYAIYVKLIYPILFSYQNVNFVLLLLSFLCIFAFGAFSHPNMNWSKKEYEKSKTVARILISVEVGSIFLFFLLGMEETYILFMSFGVILSACLLLDAKVMKKEVRYE